MRAVRPIGRLRQLLSDIALIAGVLELVGRLTRSMPYFGRKRPMQVIGLELLHSALQGAIANILNPSVPPGATLHLVKAPFVPTPTSDPITFTEADFTGYAHKTVTLFGTQHPDAAGNWFAYWETPVVEFVPTAVLSPNQSIYGYYVLGSGGEFVCAEVFPAPIVMRDPTTVLQLLVPFGVAAITKSATVLT